MNDLNHFRPRRLRLRSRRLASNIFPSMLQVFNPRRGFSSCPFIREFPSAGENTVDVSVSFTVACQERLEYPWGVIRFQAKDIGSLSAEYFLNLKRDHDCVFLQSTGEIEYASSFSSQAHACLDGAKLSEMASRIFRLPDRR